MRDMLNVIHAWHMIECLNPLEVPTDRKYRIANQNDIPWCNSGEATQMNRKDGAYVVYLGICNVEDAAKAIKLALNDIIMEYDDRNYKTKIAFGLLKISSDSIYVKDSFSLSVMPFAIGNLLTKDNSYSKWYRELEEELKQIINDILSAEKEITYGQLSELLDIMTGKVGWQPPFHDKPFWYKRTSVTKSLDDEQPDSKVVNSFFVRDLEKIMNCLSEGNLGQGMLSYLSGHRLSSNERYDLDDKNGLLSEILSPEQFLLTYVQKSVQGSVISSIHLFLRDIDKFF